VLAIAILVCYLSAAAWLIASVYRVAPQSVGARRTVALILCAMAIALHAIVLWRGVAARPEFALTIAEAASLVGFGIALIATAVAGWRLKFAVPAALLLTIAGIVAAATNEGARNYGVENRGWELNVHIGLSILAYSLVTVGTVLALTLALLDRRLRQRQPLGWMSILPPVESLESGMFAALSSGFATLSLVLFSGFFFVEDIFGQSLSRKIILSCLAWAILAVLLFGRWRFGWRGRQARNWTLGGFVVLVLAYFGSKVVLENILGRHWG
jgi:ABC-type uncharacterized transport system permease subunit